MLTLLMWSGQGVAQSLALSLSQSDHNGFAIRCFGEKDGEITALVSGGVPPYRYKWSHGDTVPHVSGLAAGYYHVTVFDSDTLKASVDITLTQPTVIKVGATPSLYPNGYNISCTDCFNGSLQTNVAGGVAPYTYLWNDGTTTTADRSALGHRVGYVVVVTDANGCEMASQRIALTQPDRNDWTMEGNVQTDPAQHYLGTVDSTDLVLKSNGAERLRLKANGKLNLAGMTEGILFLNADRDLEVGALSKPWCFPDQPMAPWYLCGNDDVNTNGTHFLGTIHNAAVRFRTHNEQRMIIAADGKVGIGTTPPTASAHDHLLFVEGGISTRDVMVKLGAWPDYVFSANYPLMPLAELRAYLQSEHHLPGMPSASELETNGGVEVGDMQRRLVRTVEEQALYILQLQEQLARMEQRLQALETSHR